MNKQTAKNTAIKTEDDLFRWGNWEPVIGVEVHVQLATNS